MAVPRRFQLPSVRASVPKARHLVRDYLAEQAPQADPSAIEDLLLAVTEGVANAVVHAHGEDGRELALEIAIDGPEVTVSILDTGPGTEPSPRPGDDPFAESGRGWALMEALCDTVRYEPSDTPGEPNRLVLVKKI